LLVFTELDVIDGVELDSDCLWHVDSGAGMSITGNSSLFCQYEEQENAPTVKFGNGVIREVWTQNPFTAAFHIPENILPLTGIRK
jgi:hypothetical protein